MTEQILKLRCSGLPLAFKCAGSVRRDEGEVLINATSDPAELGTAAHVALAVLVLTGRIDWASVPELARGQGFDEGELRMLLAAGARLWALVRDSFPAAQTEVEAIYEGDG